MFEVLLVITRYHNDEVRSRREIVTYRYKNRRTAIRKFGQIAEEIKNDPRSVLQLKGNPCKYVNSVELRYKADQALDKAGKIIIADCENGG